MANKLWKKRRLELHATFVSIIGIANQSHVYYNPPEGFKMAYPAIVYERTNIKIAHADNNPYVSNTGYLVTVITNSPDDPIVHAISELPKCSFVRHFVSDNLVHDVFTIY